MLAGSIPSSLSGSVTRTALKLPPPWPVEDARWCEVTASGSVSRFYASDRLTPPQIAALESKRRQAAILSRKPGATILNSAISPASRTLVFEARKKKLGINTVDQRNKANTLGFNPWGMPGDWTDTSDPRNKLCQCKVLCPPRGSDTASGSHYYHCRRHYDEESTRVNTQPMSIITMINDDWASLKWSHGWVAWMPIIGQKWPCNGTMWSILYLSLNVNIASVPLSTSRRGESAGVVCTMHGFAAPLGKQGPSLTGKRSITVQIARLPN